jgi:hypothetical protein
MNLQSLLCSRMHPLTCSIRTLGSLIAVAVMGLPVLASAAELIPASRLVDWTPGVSVGVRGGIPTNRTTSIDVTKAPYLADSTGVSDATGAIQAAINAAPPGTVVYLPPGTYRIGGTIGGKNNITLRGAGLSTVLASRTPHNVISAGPQTDYAWAQEPYAEPKTGNTVTAGLTKGSTALTIADTSAFSVGQMIQVSLENQSDNSRIAAGAVPIVSTSGFGTLRRQMSRIVGKSATTLTISPALHFTPDSNIVAKVHHCRAQLEGFGVESLYIDCSNDTAFAAISFSQAFDSWIKDVKVANVSNYGFYLSDSLNCEIRKSTVARRKAGGSNGAGILLGHVGNSLFEDNIIFGVMPPIEVNFSSTGNVVAYNFLYNEIGGNLNMNHGPHNSFNLYEGNITPNIQPDGYFGSASDDTIFRNWITGKLFESGTYTSIVGLNRFTRNYSLVGNILGSAGWPYGATGYSFGNPNMGNGSSDGTAQPSANIFWSSWKSTATLTTRNSDTAGTITVSSGKVAPGSSTDYPHLITLRSKTNLQAVIQIQAYAQTGPAISFKNASNPLPSQGAEFHVMWGPSGFQELDLDVERTTIRKANYHAWSEGGLAIPAAEMIASEALPSSLYRTSKPDWFGNLRWPAFDPFNPTTAYDSIPAGYRYIHGDAQPPPSVTVAPTNVRILRR